MSYLLCFFGADEPFARAAEKLSKALGFAVSATAVQRNTEETGKRMPERPFHLVDSKKQDESCDVMVAEIDGILSPQIHEEEGVSGRESLKQPTEYKECNVVVIEKLARKRLSQKPEYRRTDRFIGALYGERGGFEPYVRESALAMGQLKAKRWVFVADGAHHNWQIQLTNFPGATAILDFYHAAEHLGEYCNLFRDEQQGKRVYKRLKDLMWEGDTLQMLVEMDSHLEKLTDRSEGVKQINYFKRNTDRMAYDQYRAQGLPMGSGSVEGSCKYVVGRRFKGNGMRWKKADNKAVLRVRLAVVNETLQRQFMPRQREITLLTAAA
jgi:hypothetical protein